MSPAARISPYLLPAGKARGQCRLKVASSQPLPYGGEVAVALTGGGRVTCREQAAFQNNLATQGIHSGMLWKLCTRQTAGAHSDTRMPAGRFICQGKTAVY